MNERSPAQSDQGRIGGFDGLRAIAFLMVFLSHKSLLAHKDSYGDAGVYLFFVLSGFLITRILARSREAVEQRGGSFRAALLGFYAHRTARIFPIYYLLLAVLTILGLFIALPWLGWLERLSYWTYTANIFIGRIDSWTGLLAGHFWTLAIEEQFYLLFAPIVLLLPRSRTWAACAAFLLVGLATKLAMEASGARIIPMDVNSFINFTLLALGGLVGLAADRPAPRWLASGTVQGLVFAGFMLAPVLFGGGHSWLHYGKAVGVGAAVLLYQVYQGQRSWFVRTLDAAPLRLVGRVSYGAYLFHPFVRLPMVAGALAQSGASEVAANIAGMGAELAVTLALAGLSWALFERPIIAWAKRRS